MFDGSKPYKITKPIRLIELFAGYGSQHLALKYLRKNAESWRICEWAVKSIQAYKDMHFKEDKTDYSKNYSYEFIIDELFSLGISADYNKPMTKDQIKRMGESKCRTVYNNIKATHNLVDISQAKAKDLNITDTDKYEYIMTYSFPCQDLSKAGKSLGMARDSGTRSGLLWQVERLLEECQENGSMPQVLLMENVPDVIGTQNMPHFAQWLQKLESLGYHCYYDCLNSKHYGVPQNRDRCFMVSILGDYYYEFPKPFKLERTLKDLLEPSVDEKYYLTDKAMVYAFDCNRVCDNTKRGDLGDIKVNPEIAKTISCRGAESQRADVTNFVVNNNDDKEFTIDEIREIIIKDKNYPITKNCENYIEWHQPGLLDMDTRAWKDNKIAPTMHTNCVKTNVLETETLKKTLCNNLLASGILKENDVINHSYTNGLNGKNPNSRQDLEDYIESTNGIMNTLTTRPDTLGVVKNLRIRKLTPKECFRLMGVQDADFEKVAENQSNASLYHLAGDSIVVDVLMEIFKKLF